MPPVAMFATFIAAVQLGIARHAIDAFVELATTKIPTMSQIILADRVTAQASLGRATAMVSSARGYLENALQAFGIECKPDTRPRSRIAAISGWPPPMPATPRMRRSTCCTPRRAPPRSTPRARFDRCLRDARTALQHVCTQEVHFELAGRLALERDALASVWGLDYRGET